MIRDLSRVGDSLVQVEGDPVVGVELPRSSGDRKEFPYYPRLWSHDVRVVGLPQGFAQAGFLWLAPRRIISRASRVADPINPKP